MRSRPKRADLDLLRVTLTVHSLASFAVVTACVAALIGIKRISSVVATMADFEATER
jgi:hypothetical protein